jgi:putative oxidoreductase
MLALHGYGKITAGPERWEGLGSQMSNFGITFFPVFWGFMAAFSESFGSLFVILGLWTRQASLLLVATMGVAAMRHLSLPADAAGSGIAGAAHALEFMIVFVGLFFAGPGKYSLSGMITKKRTQ